MDYLVSRRRSRRCFKEIEAELRLYLNKLVSKTQSPLFQRD